jgi:hypothetical protein
MAKSKSTSNEKIIMEKRLSEELNQILYNSTEKPTNL